MNERRNYIIKNLVNSNSNRAVSMQSILKFSYQCEEDEEEISFRVRKTFSTSTQMCQSIYSECLA